jgi:hypothetical protein
LGNQLAVPLDVLAAEVIQQPASLSHHHQKAPPPVVISLVLAEMLGEVVDALGEQGNLDFRRAGITLVMPILCD